MGTYIIECWGFCFFFFSSSKFRATENTTPNSWTPKPKTFLRPPEPFLSCRMPFQHLAELRDASVGFHIAVMVAAAGKGDNGDVS